MSSAAPANTPAPPPVPVPDPDLRVRVHHGLWLPLLVVGAGLALVGGLLSVAGAWGVEGFALESGLWPVVGGLVLLLAAAMLPRPDIEAQLRAVHAQWVERCLESAEPRLLLGCQGVQLDRMRPFDAVELGGKPPVYEARSRICVVAPGARSLLLLVLPEVRSSLKVGWLTRARVAQSGAANFELISLPYARISGTALLHEELPGARRDDPPWVREVLSIRCDGAQYAVTGDDPEALREVLTELGLRFV